MCKGIKENTRPRQNRAWKKDMASQKLNTRWIATVASIWIQCSSGAYTFSVYSSILKSTQNYDQSTLDTVSVFKDIGGNVGVLAGLLYSFATLDHHRITHFRFLRGPWVVLFTGAILSFVGYFLVWASVVGLIRRPVPVPFMCLFVFIASQGQTYFNTANVVTGVMNFGDYSGTIVGIVKGFLGLGGAALIQAYDTIWKGDQSTFILILALLPTLVSLLLMSLVRIYESTNFIDDKKHLNAFSAVALTTAAYLLIIIISKNIFDFPSWARFVSLAILLLILIVSPLTIAIKAQREDTYHELPAGDESGQMKASFGDKTDMNMNILQAMCTLNFWLLFIAMICGMGSGAATINNISQVGESLGYTTIEINSLVSLLSIWNFLGRFGGGNVSDIFLHRMGWARPIFISITLATMSIGFIIIASGSGFPKNLYVGSIIVGVCYGCQWSLMPTITCELFGIGHMGTIFNTISIASPVGSYICSVRIIGYFYDEMASSEDNSCFGTRCFMLSFLIMASVSLFGSLVAFLLYFRTKTFYYNQVVVRRSRHSFS